MPKPVTVDNLLDAYLEGFDSQDLTWLPRELMAELRDGFRQTFLTGLCSGLSLATSAFERSKSGAQLHEALTRIDADLDRVMPERNAAASEVH